jgi:hypothetical protein
MNSTRTVVVALTCVLAVLVGIAIGLLVLVLLAATGHLLVFTTPPIQVCVGWPDDTVFSWWCTPDYTAQPPAALIGDPAFWHTLTPEGQRVGSFTDIRGHWAAPYIEQIRLAGLTAGCNANPPMYCPDAPLTRAEAAVLLSRLLDIVQ